MLFSFLTSRSAVTDRVAPAELARVMMPEPLRFPLRFKLVVTVTVVGLANEIGAEMVFVAPLLVSEALPAATSKFKLPLVPGAIE